MEWVSATREKQANILCYNPLPGRQGAAMPVVKLNVVAYAVMMVIMLCVLVGLTVKHWGRVTSDHSDDRDSMVRLPDLAVIKDEIKPQLLRTNNVSPHLRSSPYKCGIQHRRIRFIFSNKTWKLFANRSGGFGPMELDYCTDIC
jgi:hypothetical protein